VRVRSLHDSAIVVRARHLLASQFGPEVVILNLENGVYYSLDEVGARIWELLESPLTVGRIRNEIVTEYDVDARRCQRDIQSLLGALVAQGLVNIVDA
jgi:hypothetical protein